MAVLVKHKVCILLIILKFVLSVFNLMFDLKANQVKLRIRKVYEFQN